MRFYVYIWNDPKDGTPRYVGKGQADRVWVHLERPTSRRTSNMLNKRHREGYVCLPHILWCDDESHAFALETLLIKAIGREDLDRGSLFNLTDGGEGCSGRRSSAETTAKRSASNRAAHARLDVKHRFRMAQREAKNRASARLKNSIGMARAYAARAPRSCPHCGMTTKNYPMLTRWHFDNCKYRETQ